MSERPTLYDATLDRLKNNKLIVAILVIGIVLTGVLTFVEKVRSFITASRTPKMSTADTGPAVDFSRVVLSASKYWETLPRDYPNYFYGRATSGERDPKILAELAKEKKKGTYDCPYMFASPDWCRKSAAFFSQKDLQNIAIDPLFDVMVTNKRKEPVIVDSVGIEIAYAAMNTVSLGDWETTRVKVDGRYEIVMPPPPSRVIAGNKIVDIAEELKEMELPFDATAMTSKDIRPIVQDDFEWSGLPMRVAGPLTDPVYLPPGAPYRFEIVLKKYVRMPNNVVLRFFVHTNYGDVVSGYFYLLAM
ncbi:MAG: hypothetical protein LAO24_11625 [Acidobacteriia bacterium]|nr:hypothetical protein [Terriglobia bacterium]